MHDIETPDALDTQARATGSRPAWPLDGDDRPGPVDRHAEWRLHGQFDAWRGKSGWEKFARIGFRTGEHVSA